MKDKRMTVFNFVRGAAAILLSLAVGTVFIFLTFVLAEKHYTLAECLKNTGEALRVMLVGPLINKGAFYYRSFAQILAAMIPITFTGLATCVMFSANQFNLAGEGSAMAGGFVAALCGIYLHMNTGFHAVVCIVAAAAACALIMLIPALLKVKLGASEMVTSLMLNYVIMYVVLHFLNVHFADRSKGSTQTFPFAATSKIAEIHFEGDAFKKFFPAGTKLTWGFVIAMVFVVLTALFMYRTRWGYTIRMIGSNQSFAKYSGMKVGGTIVLSQVVGGILAGMGGGIEVMGRFDTFLWRELPGYGWTGVTIAILAKNNPIFVPLAAFFIAYLNKGCSLMATKCDVPSEMISIIQAAIFLFFAAEQFLSGYRQRLVVKNTQADLMKKAEGRKA